MPKLTFTLTEDEAKEECRQLLIMHGVRKKNDPWDDEGYERMLRGAISIGVMVERYEFDPETGQWERMLDLLIPDRRYS
jgi:hypothetical protein